MEKFTIMIALLHPLKPSFLFYYCYCK